MSVSGLQVAEKGLSRGDSGSSSFQGDLAVVSIKGPGVFVSAVFFKKGASKQGGNFKHTSVPTLHIDGQKILNISFQRLLWEGYTQQTGAGLIIFPAPSIPDALTVTLTFPSVVAFERELVAKIYVSEDGVEAVRVRVTHGRSVS